MRWFTVLVCIKWFFRTEGYWKTREVRYDTKIQAKSVFGNDALVALLLRVNLLFFQKKV
jgi:hypothetical protein